MAVTAPINIPAFTVTGADFREQRQFIHDELITACGDGTLCVAVVAETVEAPDAAPCEILDPLPSGKAERGSTVTFRVAAHCDPNSQPPGEGGDEGGGQVGADGNGIGADGGDPAGGVDGAGTDGGEGAGTDGVDLDSGEE